MKTFLQTLCLLPCVFAFAPTRSTRTGTMIHQSKYNPKTQSSHTLFAATDIDYNTEIQTNTEFLTKASVTKCEDPQEVFTALEALEKLMRQKRKAEGEQVAQNTLDNLTGEWRLVFTTGTKKTQDRIGGKINYFPLKAIQKFDATTEPMFIENAIYAGDLSLIKFKGDFEFSLKKSKVEFQFDQISLFSLFDINLGKEDAAKIGASTGLGSDSNVVNAKKDKKAFFNWISADDNIATARGGGGGIALWTRVEEE